MVSDNKISLDYVKKLIRYVIFQFDLHETPKTIGFQTIRFRAFILRLAICNIINTRLNFQFGLDVNSKKTKGY